MKLHTILALVACVAASGWTFHLWRTGDPSWRLSIGAALMSFPLIFMAPRLESVLLGLVCVGVSMYFLQSFKRFLPNRQ